jgi:hypothetical protein
MGSLSDDHSLTGQERIHKAWNKGIPEQPGGPLLERLFPVSAASSRQRLTPLERDITVT